MKITDVRVRTIRNNAATNNRFCGVASITIDDCFAVHGIKIIKRESGGLMLGMPSRETASGEFKDVAHPINPETRAMIEKVVFEEYDRVTAESGQTPAGE